MSRKTRVLIVEDERIAAEDLRMTLEGLGFETAGVVASGEDALVRAETGHPDLVLMDIVLKGKLNGIGTALELRRRHDLPVIYITAYSDPDTIERVKESQPYGYIHKPFDFRELQVVIETALIKHRIEKTLREREEWFSTTLKSIGDGVIAVDPAGKVTFMNRVAESLTGWTLAEAQGESIERVFRIVNDRTLRPVENPAQKVLRAGRVVRLANHTLLIRRNGSSVPIDDSGAPIRNDRAEITGVVLVFKDITEKKEIERILRESENRYRRLVETSPDAIKLIGVDGRIQFANRKAAAVFGYSSPERMNGLDAFGMIGPEFLAAAKKDVAALADGNPLVNAEYTFLRKNGSRFPVEMNASPIRDAEGGIQSIITVIRDVSERQRVMRRISSLSKFPDENPNPILRVSRQGKVLYANQASGEILELWKCDVGGKVPPAVRASIARVFSGKSTRPLDVEIRGRKLSLGIVPVPDEGYVNLFGRDVTLQKQVESLKNQHLHEQTVLAGVSKLFMNVRSLDDLYGPFAKLAARESGADYLAVIEYDALRGGLRLKTLFGMERLMKSVAALCGGDPREKVLPFSMLDADRIEAYMSRKLIPINGGLHELSAGRLSGTVSLKVGRLLGVHDLWAMGFNCQGKLMGGIVLGYRSPGTPGNRHLVESLVNQASVMIQHLAAEKALKESESRFRLIAESVDTGLWILDDYDRTAFVNRAAASALGFRIGEMTGRPVSDFMSREDFADHKRRILEMRKGHGPRFERSFRRKNGKPKILKVTLKRIQDGIDPFSESIVMMLEKVPAE
jgi:PAS domain S-box-containing protein